MLDMTDDEQMAGQQGQGTCLFEAAGLRLLHRPAPSDHALVLFEDAPEAGRLRPGWLTGPGGEAVDLYRVVPQRAGLFPADEMQALCGVLAGTNARPAIAIGAGLGGQAALRHGQAAGCAIALAFSPMGVAPAGHPTVADIPEQDIAPLAMVAFDPKRRPDALQAEALRLLDGVHVLPLPHMGHRTERTLIGDHVAREVFAAALRGDAGEVARLLRHNRSHDDGFLSSLSLACSERGHYRWAADIAEQGDPARRHMPDLAMARAEAQAGLGRPLEAVETLEGLVVSAPRSPRYWGLLIDRYEAMGQDVAVAELLELALAYTENFNFCARLIRKLSGMNGPARAQASALADMARQHWPDRGGQIDRLAKGLAGIA
ncbi:hypothetical protein SAMN05421757_101700 [Tropicimonas sediminicola]|uniref:Tetratricopeptide repeat-containing protein n=2 Tax=Tropicimonas sediminicola TaxID=1031541 RepID=A0A239D8D6_9RHOB|nr:hypothetical protein SAMN05421757_101700 [Tropicimonas sediminicola]